MLITSVSFLTTFRRRHLHHSRLLHYYHHYHHHYYYYYYYYYCETVVKTFENVCKRKIKKRMEKAG